MYNSSIAHNFNSFVYNPSLFNESILPPAVRPLGDWARLLLDIIERRHLALDEIDNEFVCLHSGILTKHIPKDIYYPVRNALEDAGVIDVNHSYATGAYSKGYRLAEPYASMRRSRVKILNSTVAKKIQRNKAKYRINLTTPVHERLFYWLQKVVLNDSAFAFLDSLRLKGRKRTRRELDLMHVADKEYYFNSDISGRVHNNIVNLASEFRQFLSIEGSKLVGLDIANSQPLFFSLYLLDAGGWGEFGDLPPPSPPSLHYVAEIKATGLYYRLLDSRWMLESDVQEFIKLTEQGCLYSWLMAKMNSHYKDNTVFKRRFFEQCFYNEPSHYQSRMRKEFNTLFPSVYKTINQMKKDDYKNAPLTMQRNEAEFILNTVCKRLFDQYPDMPVLTIHDSILTTPNHQGTVKAIIVEEFMKRGVRPTLHVKQY